jgi:ATP-dependent DNA helicase RecG
VGDENRRLGQTEERELAFDKGDAIYDKSIVLDATKDDLDFNSIGTYADKISVADISALLRSRGLYLDGPYRSGVTQAGILLFGKVPPIWSYVRYLRYDGNTAETGTRSNNTEDVRLDGTIPSLIDQARDLLADRLTVIRLTPGGRFDRVTSLPEFAWIEAVVNALTHRSYSLQGDGVRIRQFSDRVEVESPGRLSGLVRVQNIRNARFSRNPHIARVLAEMTQYVREANEGVRRMFDEMRHYGLPEPEYRSTDSSVRVTLFTSAGDPERGEVNSLLVRLRKNLGEARLSALLSTLEQNGSIATRDVIRLLDVSPPTARKYISVLEGAGLLVSQVKSPTDPTKAWIISDSPFWSRGADVSNELPAKLENH